MYAYFYLLAEYSKNLKHNMLINDKSISILLNDTGNFFSYKEI